MKHLLILFISFLAVSLNGQKDLAITLKKYKNNTNAISVTFDEKVNQYIKNSEKELNTKVDRIEILAFNKDNKISATDYKSISSALNNDSYDMLINARSKEGKVKVYGKAKNDLALSSLYAEVESEIGNIYLLMTGNIHFEELSDLDLDFNGSDIFKVLSGKKQELEEKGKQ